MKSTIIIAFIIVFVIPFNSKGQNEAKVTKKNKIYTINVETNGDQIKGFLYEVNKDSLTLTLDLNSHELTKISAEDIKKIKIRRKGRVGRSTWQGALIGAGTGFIIGMVDGDDEPGWFAMSKEAKGASLGVLLGASGAITGALIGTGSKKYIINNDLKTYLDYLAELRTYAVVNP